MMDNSEFSGGTFTELLVISVYFAFLVFVGVIFGKLVRNSQDYFKAGGQATWWLVGASMFMSGISTFTFVGNASGIFKSGWSPLAIYLANVLGFIVGGLFVGAWYRQMRIITVAEAIRERFGSRTEKILAVLLIVNGLVWTGAVLYGLAVFMGILIPSVPQWAVIVGVGVIVIGYCTVGGNWAVMANDFAQGLIMVSVTVLVTILCFNYAGGIGAFFDAISTSPAESDMRFVTPLPEGGHFMKDSYGVTWLIVTFLVQFFNQVSLFLGVRYFSAKDGKEAQKASIFAGILMCVGCLAFFVPPIFGRIFLYDEVMAMHADPMKAPEYAYAVASRFLLPSGAFILMMVSMLAAAISSLDTGLNRNSALIVRNILPSIFRAMGRERLSEQREVTYGRYITVGLGVIIMATAMFYSEMQGITLFDLMLSISNMLMLPQFVPLVLFLFVRRVPGWAALASMFAGFAPSFVNLIFDLGWSYQEKSLAILICSVSVYVLSILFYGKDSSEKRAKYKAFYETMERPVDFKKEVGASNDVFQLTQVGSFSLVLGSLALLLLFIESSPLGIICILSIAGFVSGCGVLMLWAAKREKRRIENERIVAEQSRK